jgi:hypothetical protein
MSKMRLCSYQMSARCEMGEFEVSNFGEADEPSKNRDLIHHD